METRSTTDNRRADQNTVAVDECLKCEWLMRYRTNVLIEQSYKTGVSGPWGLANQIQTILVDQLNALLGAWGVGK